MKENFNFTEMFGLTAKQCQIMYSIENQLILHDIKNEKDVEKQKLKEEWRKKWEVSVILALNETEKIEQVLWNYYGIKNKIKEEIEKANSKIWYYIAIIEATTFVPYFPLDCGLEKKETKKLKYKKQKEYLKTLVKSHGVVDPEIVDRFDSAYKKAVSKIGGKDKALIISLIAAVGAALSLYFAPQIAVALFGKSFAGLSGAALVNACLAYIGGGAIAAGGFGIAGGVAVIAGGGLILGGAIGGTATGMISLLAKLSPEIMLSQAAKLEVLLKEVILNVQKDVVSIQIILKKYRDSIDALQKELTELKLKREQDKKEISNLKKSIDILEKAYKRILRFSSSFEEGMG